MDYLSVEEFIRANKDSIIDDMKQKVSLEFISRINNSDFNDEKEMLELRIEERALSRTKELIETVLDKMGKGE